MKAAAEGLAAEGLIDEFHTTIANYPGTVWNKLAKTRIGKDFSRRAFPVCLEKWTIQHPVREIVRLLATKFGPKAFVRHEKGPFCIDAILQDLDRTVARRIKFLRPKGVYAYEDGASQSFSVAKPVGTACLYDLPIGYWRSARRLLSNEPQRWPEWASTIIGFSDSIEKLARKDRELAFADEIFVASSFTRRSLDDYPGSLAPIHVIPYGFPDACGPREYDPSDQRKLKLLFVGGLSQRKGIADVFAVADRLKEDVELTVVGGGRPQDCPALSDALKRHRWIPSLPHAEILKLMRQHDVLLFPSLFEGFGLVITEAMSQGTPVITTDRTAGPDIIEHGVNGWLVDAGSTIALKTQVEAILQERELIAVVGERARQTAMARPWETYGEELAQMVKKCLGLE